MIEEEFDRLRRSAFAIAYRMLGSVSEAEDVVQEGFLRLHRAREGGERIESPRAYLSTVVSRLSLDHLRSAGVRRETYVGEWLPEPLVASPDDDPARKAEMADSLSLAFLVLLESLSPEQRAAFLLREVFDEPYDRIAEIVGTSEQNARQLATRARRHVDEGRPRFEAARESAPLEPTHATRSRDAESAQHNRSKSPFAATHPHLYMPAPGRACFPLPHGHPEQRRINNINNKKRFGRWKDVCSKETKSRRPSTCPYQAAGSIAAGREISPPWVCFSRSRPLGCRREPW